MKDYTSEAIYAECEACSGNREVSTACARAIAGQWHGGQSSAMYAFSSTGHYDRAALLAENSENIRQSYKAGDRVERAMLDMFGTYCIDRKD